MELIDEGLLHTYDKAIESYVGAKEEIGPAKAAIIALLNSYSSKMSDINLLIKNNRYASANIIIRTAFENEIYIPKKGIYRFSVKPGKYTIKLKY